MLKNCATKSGTNNLYSHLLIMSVRTMNELHGVTRTCTHACNIQFRCVIIIHLVFNKLSLRCAIIACETAAKSEITHVKISLSSLSKQRVKFIDFHAFLIILYVGMNQVEEDMLSTFYGTADVSRPFLSFLGQL